jgi:uncharacterized protein RhaS with RHS repeats
VTARRHRREAILTEGEQQIASDAANSYYARDHLGSIREVTSSLGSLVARYDYDAWVNRSF